MVGRCVVRMGHLFAVGALIAMVAGCSDCNLAVSTSRLPNGTVGVRYFTELNSSCGGDVWAVSTGLPPGIGLQENGDVAGTPTFPGIYAFTVSVFDFGSGETAFKSLSIEIFPQPPAPTPTTTPTPIPTASG